MSKSAEAFRTISEVSELLDVPTHVLRFWESKFSQIKPVKRAGGRRYYRPADVALIVGIRHLLQVEGLALREAQKRVKELGVRKVSALASLPSEVPAVDAAPETQAFSITGLRLLDAIDEDAPEPEPAPEELAPEFSIAAITTLEPAPPAFAVTGLAVLPEEPPAEAPGFAVAGIETLPAAEPEAEAPEFEIVGLDTLPQEAPAEEPGFEITGLETLPGDALAQEPDAGTASHAPLPEAENPAEAEAFGAAPDESGFEVVGVETRSEEPAPEHDGLATEEPGDAAHASDTPLEETAEIAEPGIAAAEVDTPPEVAAAIEEPEATRSDAPPAPIDAIGAEGPDGALETPEGEVLTDEMAFTAAPERAAPEAEKADTPDLSSFEDFPEPDAGFLPESALEPIEPWLEAAFETPKVDELIEAAVAEPVAAPEPEPEPAATDIALIFGTDAGETFEDFPEPDAGFLPESALEPLAPWLENAPAVEAEAAPVAEAEPEGVEERPAPFAEPTTDAPVEEPTAGLTTDEEAAREDWAWVTIEPEPDLSALPEAHELQSDLPESTAELAPDAAPEPAPEPEPEPEDSAYTFVAPRPPADAPRAEVIEIEPPAPEEAPQAKGDWHQPSFFDLFNAAPANSPAPIADEVIEPDLPEEEPQSALEEAVGAESPLAKAEEELRDAVPTGAEAAEALETGGDVRSEEPPEVGESLTAMAPEVGEAEPEAEAPQAEENSEEPLAEADRGAPLAEIIVEIDEVAVAEAALPAFDEPNEEAEPEETTAEAEPGDVPEAPIALDVEEPPEDDPLSRVVSLILGGAAPLPTGLAAARQIDPGAEPLKALVARLPEVNPETLSPMDRMRLLSAHDRLLALRARLGQPPRPPRR